MRSLRTASTLGLGSRGLLCAPPCILPQAAYVTGRLNKSEGADKAVLERSEALELKGHRPLLVSKHDFKLLRLKQLLSDAQVPCNVHGAGREQHLLVSRSRGARVSGSAEQDQVMVRQSDGRLQLEGALSDLYFEVRKVIYDNLTML